jgi:hypothetical protein
MNADMQNNMNNMTLMKTMQIITIVTSTLMMFTHTAGAAGITAVRTDKGRAVIEVELDPSTGLRVFVGQESPHWTTWVNKVTNLTATVEASSQIRLQDGSFGKGFIFRCYATIQPVAITQDGPAPFGELTFRDNEKVSRSGGIFTFADIRKSDGTLVPVSVRAWKGHPPVNPALAQPEQSGMQGGAIAAGSNRQTEDKAHCEWLAKIIKEIQTIKVGMSRRDVEKILVEDVAGFTNPKAMRYQHPACSYIKLDLEFELATSGDRKDDKITKRSMPLLDLVPNKARW